jgi:hypothetical protein
VHALGTRIPQSGKNCTRYGSAKPSDEKAPEIQHLIGEESAVELHTDGKSMKKRMGWNQEI